MLRLGVTDNIFLPTPYYFAGQHCTFRQALVELCVLSEVRTDDFKEESKSFMNTTANSENAIPT